MMRFRHHVCTPDLAKDMEHSGKAPLIIDVDTGTDDAICIAAATLSTELVQILGFGTVAAMSGSTKQAGTPSI